MDQRPRLRVVICGISDLILVDPKIMMQKQPDVSVSSKKIGDQNTPQINVIVARDRIVADDREPEFTIRQSDVRD
jgi:hypothetical protein